MDERQFSYLQEMGIPVWISRDNREDHPLESLPKVPILANSHADSEPVLQADMPANSEPQNEMPLDWGALQKRVSHCQHCSELANQRTQSLFGLGNPQADWLIIGEAPGAEEDRKGEPFVGPAGQLLDAMLRAIGLNRTKVYIANILKCRPPNGRDPKIEEIAACSGYLQRQIELIQPKVVLVMGHIAAQALLKSTAPMEKLRSQIHQIERPQSAESKIPLVVTYHPAHLLRAPAEKAKAWHDLKLARRVCEQ